MHRSLSRLSPGRTWCAPVTYFPSLRDGLVIKTEDTKD